MILLQAQIQYRQGKFEEAISEAGRALDIFEKLGATSRLAACKALLLDVEQSTTSGSPNSDGEFLSYPTSPNTPLSHAVRPGTPRGRHNTTGTDHLTPPVIPLSRSRSDPTRMMNRRRSNGASESHLPAYSGPHPFRHPQQPQPASLTTSRSPSYYPYRIRLVPYIDSDNFFWFDPVSFDVKEGDPPLRIGRFANPPSPGIPKSPANVLNLESEVVSATHAEIWVRDGGGLYIRDVGSSKGTFLNHVRLSSSGLESVPFMLEDGDVLQLGVDLLGLNGIDNCVKIRVEVNR